MEGYISEIKGFAANFAPRNWAYCQGQSLSISQNQTLHSLLGTNYGGDGRTYFNLPDLRGRTPIGSGHGPGLTQRRIGQLGGEENHALLIHEIPSHNHIADASGLSVNTSGLSADLSNGSVNVNNQQATNPTPTAGNSLSASVSGSGRSATPVSTYNNSAPNTALHSSTLSGNAPVSGTAGLAGSVNILNNGGNRDHNNLQPYLVINWIICMFGTYPSRS